MAANSTTSEKAYWIIVADEARAIVYTRPNKREPLHEALSLHNEIARVKTEQLISDRGGRSFDSHGHGRHTMIREKSDIKKSAAAAFAKTIAAHLGKALHAGSCRGYALVAAPRFLGTLREAIASATTMAPYASIDKEVVGQDTSVIEKLLAS